MPSFGQPNLLVTNVSMIYQSSGLASEILEFFAIDPNSCDEKTSIL